MSLGNPVGVARVNVRDGDLGGRVVVDTEGPALQHLEAEALAFIAVNVHGHDGERKLACVLHFKTLLDGEQRLAEVTAQT